MHVMDMTRTANAKKSGFCMKSLMIVEPSAEGHRMQYVRRIARQAIHIWGRVQLLTLPASLAHPAYEAMQEELGGQIETVLLAHDRLTARLINSSNLAAVQIAYFLMFARAFRKLGKLDSCVSVFVPYLDHCDKAVALLGSPFGQMPWSGLAMNYKFHHHRMGVSRSPLKWDSFKQSLYVRLLENTSLRTLFTIDELLHDYTHRLYPRLAPKLQYVADPVDMIGGGCRESARRRFGIPADDIVLLIYGLLSPRKGIDSVLSAVQLPEFPTQVSLLFAGSQDVQVQALLAGPSAQKMRAEKRLYECNKFLSDEEEYAAFKAADVVWVGYKEFYGMSGVMVQAGKMELPIIACREGLIGWMARKYGLGVTVDVAKPKELALALTELVQNPTLRTQYGCQGAHLAKLHASVRFATEICDRL
jgi:glycosyltransferase involved in cell wall biosynthesis